MTMGSLQVCKGDCRACRACRAWRGMGGFSQVPGLLVLGGCEADPQGARITFSKN